VASALTAQHMTRFLQFQVPEIHFWWDEMMFETNLTQQIDKRCFKILQKLAQ